MWHGCRSRDIRLTSRDLWMESKLTSDTTSWRSAPISFWYRIYAAWFKYVITWTLRHRGLSSLTMNCYDYPGINIKDLLENRASHIQIVAPYVALRFRPTSDVWSVHTHDDTHVVETFPPFVWLLSILPLVADQLCSTRFVSTACLKRWSIFRICYRKFKKWRPILP
jgi:hypothetical protein